MSSNFDTSLDSFSDPGATSKLNSPSHSQQHINLNDAIEKIEAKVGVTGSAVTTTHDYKLSLITGTKKASPQVQVITPYSPAIAATQNLDLDLGSVFVVTMPAGALTLTVSNEVAGRYFSVEIVNATSQGTLTWFTTIKWIGNTAPTLTATNGKKDTFVFRVTGSDTYDGYIVGMNI